jgi:diguanylate cyclase (GGDEF)-like protein/putative nucleotidyltransferase with HDIG domain
MPTGRFRDLPRPSQVYVAFIVAAGSLVVVQSFVQLYLHNSGWTWTILALLTLVSGSATVHLPGLPAIVSVSETFVFTSVLLFGPPAGTLTVALDALVISFWSHRKGHPYYKIFFNVGAVSLTLFCASHLYYALSSHGPLYYLADKTIRLKALLWPLLACTIAYYGLNTWLITIAIALERQTSALRIWRDNFVWIALNYFGGASVAALLVSYTHDVDYSFLVIIVPLLVVLYFTFSTSMGRVEDANRHLSQLNSLYMSTIETLAMAIDAKDQITHGHIRRVQTYAVGLAKAIGVTEPNQINAIEAASLLHDMGKLAVPEYILNKPGPLTPAEFEKMKMHASVGADILSAIEFPYPVVPIVRHHHENWDGSGYPDGLRGADIPIGARILSVVDCFDALTSDRPYRPRLTDKEALRILGERRGIMYDPVVVDTFVRVHTQIAPVEHPPSSAPSLRAIADSATPAIESYTPSARLEEISASTDEMLTLFDLAKDLSPSMNVSDIADIIAKHVRRLVPCSLCVFYLFDPTSDELVASHVSGEQAGLISGLRIARGQRLSGWVAANRQTIRNSDPVLDFGESARSMTPRPRSCLSAPLTSKADLVGVLTLYSSNRNAFSPEHERVIEIISRQVAPALKLATEFQTQKLQSHRDQLTGLPNLEQFLQFSQSARQSGGAIAPAALLLIDVDNLKEINAEYGRATGDAVLNHVVNATRRLLRSSDILFRHEEDQFIVVMLHAAEGAASSLAERVTQAARFSKGEFAFELSVSTSLAVAARDSSDFEGLLNCARNRLSRNLSTDERNQSDDRVH